jgi:murein DD-endopeptidase MepM/ murein hydrolase activator NlpD
MNRDERFYAFIISSTNRPRACIRRITVHPRWVKVSAAACALLFGCAAYGLYGLTQQAIHLRIQEENNRLRLENERQRQQLRKLENRVDAIEDTSRRLSEISGVQTDGEEGTDPHGAGGPSFELDAASVSFIEVRAARLEEELKAYEAVMRERARIPSIWPVEGETTDRFGVRGNPFGGGSTEFHPGQDISAPRGTPVVAPADGTVAQAGWQNGYGNTVVLDHGNGLTTRYGHLSKIEVSANQELKRGDLLGEVGSTGRSTGPHLHYEVRLNDEAVNPRAYMAPRGDGTAAAGAAGVN